MRILLFVLFLNVFSCFAGNSQVDSLSKAKAVVLCYPTDKVISNACDEIERRLKSCKTAQVEVVRKNNVEPLSVGKELAIEKLPPQTPVFIVGHGMADLEHRHYLATQMFWQEHPEKVKTEAIPRLVEEGNLVSGKTLNSEVNRSIKSPAIWYLSCHSGGNCTEGGNIGASCSSWETSGIAIANPIVKINLKIDPATRNILRLLCEPGEFSQIDKDSNQIIAGDEWMRAFTSHHEKTVSIPIANGEKVTEAETKKRVLQQLGSDAIVDEQGQKLNLTQKRCVNSAVSSQEPFLASPVVSHFLLPFWTLQNQTRTEAMPYPSRTPSKTH